MDQKLSNQSKPSLNAWLDANEMSQQFKRFIVLFTVILGYSYKFGKILEIISFFRVFLEILKDKIEKVVFQRKFE